MRRAEKTVFKKALEEFTQRWCTDEEGKQAISNESEICVMLGGIFKFHPELFNSDFTRLCVRIFNTKVNDIESAGAPRGGMEFGALDESTIQEMDMLGRRLRSDRIRTYGVPSPSVDATSITITEDRERHMVNVAEQGVSAVRMTDEVSDWLGRGISSAGWDGATVIVPEIALNEEV